MDQDGKLEQSPKAGSSGAENRSEEGKILLTLCTALEDESPYQHATIRFPSSYQEACTTAMDVFSAYIPLNVEAVSLRQAFRRADGQYVWSILREHRWDVTLDRHGEEVGVFLPDIAPDKVPYRKPPTKLVCFCFERTKKEIESIRVDEAKKYAQSLVDKGILKPNDVEKLDSIDTEGLIAIHVAQLSEKERKELAERLRVHANQIDNIEQAYRKEERPLLDQDYNLQQKTNKETFQDIQSTKERLSCMMADCWERKEAVLAKKDDEYNRKVELARKKIKAEKEKRREVVIKQREEERVRQEKEDDVQRQKEAEEARLAAERAAEEERIRQEKEAAAEAAAKLQRLEEAEAAERREQREKERQEATEKARLQQQRKAETRRQARAAEKANALCKPVVAPTALCANAPAKEGPAVWRRPGVPAATASAAPSPLLRSENPAEGAAPKRRPGTGVTEGGWRARKAAQDAAAATPSATPPVAPEEPKVDTEGFQTMSSTRGGTGGGVWPPKRGPV